MNEFYQLIQDTVSRSPIGAKAVAVKIGKPYSTMMREVNPNDKGAKSRCRHPYGYRKGN